MINMLMINDSLVHQLLTQNCTEFWWLTMHILEYVPNEPPRSHWQSGTILMYTVSQRKPDILTIM